MKYLAFIERNVGDFERLTELWKQVQDEREKRSDMFPKTLLFEPHTLQADLPNKTRDLQGFFIFETEDQSHLMNYVMHYAPYMNIRFIPITEDRKTAEAWLGWER